nr:MAG TPA: hypothetical protein [Caudoviricetes sp.]
MSSPEPIRLAASRFIREIYLTLKCQIKKLSKYELGKKSN